MLSKLIQKYRLRNITYGKNVYVGQKCTFLGNIFLGDRISIGPNSRFVSTRAKLYIHDSVVIGPEVTIYTGDHQIDILGKHIIDIGDKDKSNPNLDSDVVIESGCWIGTRAIILKGVTIGRGSVIGAGAVVTKDVPPYSIYVGVPEKKVLPRFTAEQIVDHESLLINNGEMPDSYLGASSDDHKND